MSKKTILSILTLVVLMTMLFGVLLPVYAEFPFTTSLTVKNSATSTWTTSKAYTGFYSVHLETTGTVHGGDEARFVVTLPSGITLGDLYTISWQEFLVAGYPPHVDVILDLGTTTDALVFEYAYNNHVTEGQWTYGALTGFWYQTFSDDGSGPTVIDGSTSCWLSSGPAGGPGIIDGTLNEWKTGGITGGLGIDATTPILRLEFEIDNWMAQTEAYLDDVEINGLDIMGIAGPKGDTGLTGPKGNTGSEGDRGSRGLTGTQGPIGLQGEQGEAGLTGEAGSDGLQGPMGDTGSQGLPGIDGETGPLGETGYRGPQGVAGEAGSQGPKGDKGDTGAVGPKGSKGEPAPASVAYGGAALGGVSLLGLLYMFFRSKP